MAESLLVLGDISVPGLPVGIPTGPIDIGVPDLPSLNPLHYLSDAMNDLLNGLLDAYQKRIIHPERPSLGSIQSYWSSQVLELSLFLALAVWIILFCVATFMPRKWVSVGQATVVSLLIFVLGPFYLYACGAVQVGGDNLSGWIADQYTPSGGHAGNSLLAVPTINNLMGIIAGTGAIMTAGVVLLGMIYIFEYLALFFKVFGLVLFSVSPLSEKLQRWWDWALSIAIVAGFSCRPMATAGLVFGRTMADHLPGGADTLGKVLYLIVTFIITIILEFGLIFSTHHVIVRWNGRQNTNSKVTGNVNTKEKAKRPITLKHVSKVRVASMTVNPTSAVMNVGKAKMAKSAKSAASRRSKRQGSQVFRNAANQTNTASGRGRPNGGTPKKGVNDV